MNQSSDQYEIIKKIGEGGMGVVYLANDKTLNRQVAIKELKNPSLQADGSFADRFRQEAYLLAQLNHINITHIYSFIPYNNYYWMIMEYARGRTLEDWFKTNATPSVSECCNIIEQVLAGVSHAHKKGIIHRDLKPANIMIGDEGDVKIMDFGIARINKSVKRLTSHGKTLGTLEYMAPEQIKGQEGDERSDIYSIGSIFYELLSGHLPFERLPDFELMKAKLEKKAKPLSATKKDIPPALQKIVAKSLECDPANRYQNADAVISALKEFRLPKPVESNDGSFLKLNPAALKFSNPLKKIPAFNRAVSKNANKPKPIVKFNWAVLILIISALASIVILWTATIKKNEKGTGTSVQTNDQFWEKAATNENPKPVTTKAISNNIDSIPFNETPNEMLNRISKKKDDSKQVAAKIKSDKSKPPTKKPVTSDAIEEEMVPSPQSEANNLAESRKRHERQERPHTAETITVSLNERLSSEDKSRDGKIISLRVLNDVTIDGRVWIKKGGAATGKIVDVVPSGGRKKALIGFVIRTVVTADGNEIRVSSPRYRNFANELNQPAYFLPGQSFTVQTGRGRPAR